MEQSWDQITVKFYHREYFGKFVDSLMTRYVALRVWNDPRRQPEGCEQGWVPEDCSRPRRHLED